MRFASYSFLLGILFLAACAPQPKADTNGNILSEKDAVEKLTMAARWCGQDTDNDGTYSIQTFSPGGNGIFSTYNKRTRTSTSDPMKWNLADDRMTRTLPTSYRPNVLKGRVRFGTDKGVQTVKLIDDDTGLIEVLSDCDGPSSALDGRD